MIDKEQRIKFFEDIFNSEALKYIYLVSLISADALTSKEKCEVSLEKFKFIKENINIMKLSKKNKKEIMKYVNKGLSIVYKEIKNFEQ